MESEQIVHQQDIDAIKDPKEQIMAIRDRKAEVKDQYKQLAIDYLNLVFGVG